MKGKTINVRVFKEHPTYKKNFPLGFKTEIQVELYDKDVQLVRERLPSTTRTVGPFWDAVIAEKGTFKSSTVRGKDGQWYDIHLPYDLMFKKLTDEKSN